MTHPVRGRDLTEKLIISTLRDWWYSFRRVEAVTSIEFANDIIRVLDTAGFAIVHKGEHAASACKRRSVGPRQWKCEHCGCEWFDTGMPQDWLPERCFGHLRTPALTQPREDAAS